jgi:hypothetical protein
MLCALAVAGPAGAAPVHLTANLKGNEEVPGPGDPNGKGDAALTVRRKAQRICFHIEHKRIETPDAGHIHRGEDGVAGPVRVTLFDTASESPIDGCVEDIRRKLIRKIATRPQNYYVNLHNSAFPDGAIRGQLKPA